MNSEKEYSAVEISDICYCFSPFIVKSTCNSGIDRIDFVIYMGGSLVYNDSLYYNKEKEIRRDVSGILRALFDYKGIRFDYGNSVENSSYRFNIDMYIVSENGKEEHLFYNIILIYGAVKYGELYYGKNSNKKIKHFIEFPFYIDFLIKPGGRIKDSSGSIIQYNNMGTLGDIFKYYPNQKRILKPYTVSCIYGGISVDTNSYPYITKTEILSTSIVYNVTVDTCTEGVYLMWLNREGMRSFYLFKNMGVTTTVEGEEYQKTLSYNTSYIENPKQVNKEATKVITLAVAMADKEEYSYIESVLTSPEVYMYDRESRLFTKINVVTGDFERTGAELQDFTFQIELPEEYTVKL